MSVQYNTEERKERAKSAFLSTLPPEGFSDTLTGKLCGRFLEVYKTTELQFSGLRQTKGSPKEPESDESLLQRSISRSRKMVRQLTNTNELNILHTLTFAVDHPEYFKGEKKFLLVPLEFQKDREKVLAYWKEFARKMRAYEESKNRMFRYLAVIEKHTGKRAAIDHTIKTDTYHIHFLSDRVHGKRLLQAKWRHGFCNYAEWGKGSKSNDMSTEYDGQPVDNPGAYASKYIGKDMDGEYKGRKRYWSSRNLSKPIAIHGEDVRALVYGKMPIFEDVRDIEIDGQVIKIQRFTFIVDRQCAGFTKVRKPTPRSTKQIQRLKRLETEAFIQYYHFINEENRRKNNGLSLTSVDSIQRTLDKKRIAKQQAEEGFR